MAFLLSNFLPSANSHPLICAPCCSNTMASTSSSPVAIYSKRPQAFVSPQATSRLAFLLQSKQTQLWKRHGDRISFCIMHLPSTPASGVEAIRAAAIEAVVSNGVAATEAAATFGICIRRVRIHSRSLLLRQLLQRLQHRRSMLPANLRVPPPSPKAPKVAAAVVVAEGRASNAQCAGLHLPRWGLHRRWSSRRLILYQ